MRKPALALLCLAPAVAWPACFDEAVEPAPVPTAVFVTFNTGTAKELPHDDPPDDGYGAEEAAITDEHYGNGLSFVPAIEAASAFFAQLQPDVVAFQEVFHPGDCELVPVDARAGFICERYAPSDPTVAQLVLGQGYQVACHQQKPDKCLGVRRQFATIRGCTGDLCLDFLDGAEVEGCGGGSRVGRAVLDLADGKGELTVVNVHGSSGITDADFDCRRAQFELVFVDLGDGEPAANGERSVVLGDFNTDPARFAGFDWSAQRLNELVGPGKSFQFLTSVGWEVDPTYANAVNLDHVITNGLAGSCVHPGATEGTEPVAPFVYFDHTPAVCTIELP